MNKKQTIALVALLAMSSATTWAQGLKDAYKDYFMIGVAVNQRNVTNADQQQIPGWGLGRCYDCTQAGGTLEKPNFD